MFKLKNKIFKTYVNIKDKKVSNICRAFKFLKCVTNGPLKRNYYVTSINCSSYGS